jgi:hypothetical protein
MRMDRIALVVLSVGIAGGAWLGGRASAVPKAGANASPAAAPQTGGEGSGDVEALRREVAALRAGLANVGRRVDERPAPEARAERAEAPPPLPPEERKRAALEQQTQAIAALDARLQGEREDRGWAAEVRRQIGETLGDLAGSSLRSVDCRASLCRAELTHPDPQALEGFISKYSGAGPNFQLFYQREGDALATTVFVARRGQPAPDVVGALRAER